MRIVRTMGTVISIDVRAPQTPMLRVAVDAAESLLRDVDAMFSTYREDSWISRLARRDVRPGELPPPVTEVLELCAEVEQLTDGWFTARWRGDGTLDPTGVVKGWAAERASRLLAASGFPDHCVNAAGDITVGGRAAEDRNWRIGVSDPRENGALLGVIEAPTCHAFAVATSGLAERGLHIRDPRTGRPADAVLAATVAGPVLSLADGLATALVAAGIEAPALLAHWRAAGWSGAILTAAGDLIDPDELTRPLAEPDRDTPVPSARPPCRSRKGPAEMRFPLLADRQEPGINE
ncbi:MAG: ApbE family lipoprotein [Blastococcus sp.]|nr:ApbE family lipoprotein [Blastococcus sp.]